jgi:hypothetical protein
MQPVLVEVGNADCRWDEFDPNVYCQQNYAYIHENDIALLETARDHFEETLGGGRKPVDGIDVGAGANLYPSLAMLPYCENVTLFERGRENRKWLFGQRESFSTTWDPYWELLTKNRRHAALEPRQAFGKRMQVRNGDILDNGNARNRFGLGTMFFVAESITQREREFQLAVNNFITMLKPGAPFAAAFMWESKGYRVGNTDFPAVSIGPVDVEHHLESRVDDLKVTSVESERPLREGYKGMILAIGRRKRTKG